MYHVIQSEPGLYTVGTGTPGVDWEPIADFARADMAQAEAERRNSPQVYALLDKAQGQIEELIARLDELSTRVDELEEDEGGLTQFDIADMVKRYRR